MENQVKFINCNDLEIMASVEGKVTEKHAFYHPAIVLIYLKKGTLHIEINKQKISIPKDNFILINRFTQGFMHKTWTEEEQEAQMYAFILADKFVDKVRRNFTLNTVKNSNGVDPLYILPPNHILNGLFDSIFSYINEYQELDTQLVELKTLEAMMGILKFHPECHVLFQQEFDNQEFNLQQFIETNYMYNVPLNRLAEMSGKSLSTFCREFKAIYNEPPHRWIKKRRLLKAKELLLNTNRRPSEFYLELGFESLAHFSRTFKKEFGVTLTDFRKSNHAKIN